MSLGNRQYVENDGLVHEQAPINAGPAAQPLPRSSIRRTRVSGLIFVGMVTTLLGIWGGIVPFIGPTFGFSADGSGAWDLTGAHLLLAVLPGAVAFVAGILMLGIAPRAIAGSGRWSLTGAGVLALLAGGWFVVGPLARPVFSTAGHYFASAGPLRELAFQIGYSFGPGLLIVLAGGFGLGWSARHQRLTNIAMASTPAPTASAYNPTAVTSGSTL